MKPEKKIPSTKKQHQQSQQQHAATSSINPTHSHTAESSTTQQIADGKTQAQEMAQKIVYSESAVRNNFQVLEQSRTCQAAVSGIASGILGLTGAIGFVFYFVCVLVQAFIWNYKAGFQWTNYFPNRWLLVTHSLVGGLFTYVLFWVFVYGLVHVY